MATKRRSVRERSTPVNYFKEDSSEDGEYDSDNTEAAKLKMKQLMNEDSDAESDFETEINSRKTAEENSSSESETEVVQGMRGDGANDIGGKKASQNTGDNIDDVEEQAKLSSQKLPALAGNLETMKDMLRTTETSGTNTRVESSLGDVDINYDKANINPVKKNSLKMVQKFSSYRKFSSVQGQQSRLARDLNEVKTVKMQEEVAFQVVAGSYKPRLLRPPMTGSCRSSNRAPNDHGCLSPGDGGGGGPLPFPGPRETNLMSPGPRMTNLKPPQPEQFLPASPSQSAINKLSSLGVSIERSSLPPPSGVHCLTGISISRTLSLPDHDGPTWSVSTLATALRQLGEGEGRKRPVRYRLTEEQIRALQTLGIEEK